MEFLFLLGGVLIGVIIATVFSRRESIYGIIEIDHETEQCRSRITNDELMNRKTKRAVFVVTHDAKISRE